MLIKLLENIFNGNEKEVVNIYQSIYTAGVDPSTFLNDFLEILYYLKNIDSIQLNGFNFDLNDSDYKSIKNLKDSVKIAKKYYQTEASGNVTLKTVKAIASTGVNRISVGSITHSAPAIDFKLEI